MTARKTTTQYDFMDRLAHADIEEIARRNASSFYRLKENLVEKRQRLCSLDRIAELLKESVEEVDEFEQYSSDPTVSQLQEYALAVMSVIDIGVFDFQPDASSMYLHTTVPADASELLDIEHDSGETIVDSRKGQVMYSVVSSWN